MKNMTCVLVAALLFVGCQSPKEYNGQEVTPADNDRSLLDFEKESDDRVIAESDALRGVRIYGHINGEHIAQSGEAVDQNNPPPGRGSGWRYDVRVAFTGDVNSKVSIDARLRIRDANNKNNDCEEEHLFALKDSDLIEAARRIALKVNEEQCMMAHVLPPGVESFSLPSIGLVDKTGVQKVGYYSCTENTRVERQKEFVNRIQEILYERSSCRANPFFDLDAIYQTGGPEPIPEAL